jgi:exopolyphosphatase/guanosine-5'-triphosphate,3'-diphosphate pyrophosphatase
MMKTLVQEARALRDRYDEEPVHSDHVAALALAIFDVLKPWHEQDARTRSLLHAAALMHDIGWSQTPEGRGHHKMAARMISAHPWKALKPSEVDLVAQVARYHRRAIPEPGHAAFHALPAGARRKVMILGGILRIADALDRTHIQRVKRIASAQINDDVLLIRIEVDSNWEAEKAIFEAKRNMIELASERHVRVEAVK